MGTANFEVPIKIILSDIYTITLLDVFLFLDNFFIRISFLSLDKKLDYSTHKKGRPLAFRKRPDFKFIFNLIFLD